MDKNFTIVCAADRNYFDLLKGLINSIQDKPEGQSVPISVLDLGFTEEQTLWLDERIAHRVEPEWDFEVPARFKAPSHFRALLARPFLPRYFPGYEVYHFIDADAWVQDWSVVDMYVKAAWNGKLAITPQIDRAYNTFYKRSKRLGRTQNFKSFKWSYGWKIADRLGRNPILNAGVFALASDAPHWSLWADAIDRALHRTTLYPRKGWPHLHFKLVEQTAINYVAFGDKAPVAMLPATCNWFCALAAPMIDTQTACLVEPNEPYTPLGIVHLAGEDFQNKEFDLETTDGRFLTTRLRYDGAPFQITPESNV